MMDKEEIILESQRLGPLNRDKEAHAEAVRQARLGSSVSEDAKKKISATLIGHKQSAETIAKRVLKTKGQVRPNTSAAVSGGNNGSAKSVVINNIRYETIKQAMESTGLSRYRILKEF